METFTPTPLRVSTMTVTGHLGVAPDLQALFTAGAHIQYWQITEGILKMEFGDERRGFCTEDILHTSTKAKKRFFNQSSLVFRLALADGSFKETPDPSGVSLSAGNSPCFKETNIKLFKNGGFQMTGISSAEMARAALTRLMELNVDRGVWPSGTPWVRTFDVHMMNSDYSVGKAIRRDRLYKILVEEYGLWSTFEPTIYQGVNTKFFWNKARPAGAPPGICVCPEPCEGDGDGYSIGHCKKITISPFRTGSIIITGARHPEQLSDAYEFMNGVLRKHPDVLREETAAPTQTNENRKQAVIPTDPIGILRLRMRASPRNRIQATAVTVA